MKTRLIGILVILFCFNGFAQEYKIQSPDENLEITINVKKDIKYNVTLNNKTVISPSRIDMTLSNGIVLGENPTVRNSRKNTINNTIRPIVKTKRSTITDNYNKLTLTFNSNFGLEFRAYNDGAAYRFFTSIPGKIKIKNEHVEYRLDEADSCFYSFVESFHTSYEELHHFVAVNSVIDSQKSYLPVLVEKGNGVKLVITEADLDDYAGLYLKGTNDHSATLVSTFPNVALKEKQVRDRKIIVSESADYIAETKGSRFFPWRVMVISENDGTFIESDMVYRLAKSNQIKDTSWIQSGKVVWEWWNASNLYNVDFKSGLNTDTYKAYIDFAAQYGIEYVLFDEGWSGTEDLLHTNPEVNMPVLIDYAKEKGVKILLWCVWVTVENQLDEAFAQFEDWGIAGVKIDFMDRDDQKIVNWYKKIVKKAAEHHLLVDFHGAYKPTGLRREYPNLMTREGVRGNEYNKWSKDETPDKQVLIPFTRMLAGPIDFTPGAMRNTNKNNFNPVFERPMSQGTRVHQLAMYVVYESPLQMLCDSPSNYEREPANIMDLIANVPVEWDETKVLDAKIEDYLIVARRSGNTWYVGAMADWTPRDITVDLSFLTSGSFMTTIYKDGINADRFAEDYIVDKKQVTASDKLNIHLAPGGGCVIKITP